MRNLKSTIFALGLAIVLAFGFNTPLNASGFGVEQVEQGSGTIEEMVLSRTSLQMNVECHPSSILSVYSVTGVILYTVSVNSGVVNIPINGWEPGSYYIVLREGEETTMATFSVN